MKLGVGSKDGLLWKWWKIFWA